MALKSDDILNIDIDPELLLSYGMDKLNVDDISNVLDFSDEIPKNGDNSDAETDSLAKSDKVTGTDDSKSTEDKVSADCSLKSSTTIDKSTATELKVECPSRNTKRKKDINGNEEPLSGENLNQLFDKLELSDSDNEDRDDRDSSKLRERAPIRAQRRASRNREQNNILGRNESYDRTEFSSERLRFLSGGSNQIQLNETFTPNQFGFHNNLPQFNECETVPSLSSIDSFYEDPRSISVSSPESGYDSSAQSITGSPPPVSISTSLNLDFIPETVDEQNILDFLIENTDGALINNNLSTYDTDEKDAKGKISEIINFLKDMPSELNESSDAIALSDNTADVVPLASHTEDLNTSPVTVSTVSYNSVTRNLEIPKKIVYKLDDKAKKALRDFLSKDEFYAVKEKIYKKINEDTANKKKIKVIYVEDEMDKTSENRTNLHYAVLNSKIEDIYCLVEIHKQYNLPFTDINIRDKYGKTALDYAIQNEMNLVVDYLKENTACQSVNV